MSVSYQDKCSNGEQMFPSVMEAAEWVVKQFPEAYENVSSAAAAIVDSMVNENEVCGWIWEKDYLPLPVVGHLLEGQGSTPLSKETTTNEGQTDLNAQIADYQALIDRKLASTLGAWKDNYMRLNAELFRDTKLIDQKRENRPTRKTAADDVQLWFGYTFLARKENDETYIEYGNLFTFLDSIYATLRKDDLRSLLEDGKAFGYLIKINEAQRACLEAYYDLWQ